MITLEPQAVPRPQNSRVLRAACLDGGDEMRQTDLVGGADEPLILATGRAP
jgi:hypothetical protein